MSDGATPSDGLAALSDESRSRKALILITASVCTTLYSITVTIVNIALPQLQGALSATPDQIAWVITLNVVATAVVTPLTGWLVANLGQRRLMLIAVAGFAVTSLFCALSETLETLILWRVGQGIFGAPIVPLSQAILLATYPGRDRARAQGFFGMAVIFGPAIAPAIGGWLAEAYDWRWIFFLIVPFCIAAFFLTLAFIREGGRDADLRLDWTGFFALSVAIVCLQLTIDQGERSDWFESDRILVYTGLMLLFFYLFAVHNATTPKPFVNPLLFTDRNYLVGLILVLIYGMLNFTPITLLPPMLQGLKGYPDSLIGTLIGMRGIGMVVGFFLAGWLGSMDPRISLSIGTLLTGISGLMMAGFEFDVPPSEVALAAVIQGIGGGLMWVPLTIVCFATLPPKLLSEGSAIFHLLRNFGSSIFISICVMVVVRSARINYSGLVEEIGPLNEALRFSSISGGWTIEDAAGILRLSAEVERQSSMIGYENAFLLYAVVCFSILPLLLFVRIRGR
eukprot:XP_011407743.1 PREDICTED: uncharacterized protein LOC105314972 [Amphimedon queenslandica]